MNYDYTSRFSSWLYTIGLNLARNLLRWRTRHPEGIPFDETGELTESELADSLAEFPPTPSRQAEVDEWTDALEQALARLPARLRKPLLLVALDGCPEAEVAAHLGCTVKAVETRLYHGRKRLRAELDRILNPWRCRVEAAIRLEDPLCHESICPVPLREFRHQDPSDH